MSKLKSPKPERTKAPKKQPEARTPPSPSAGSSVGQLAVLIIAVLGLVLLAHWPALSAEALSFDDDVYIAKNNLIPRPSLASAGQILAEVSAPSVIVGYYHPLSMISLMLDVAMGGRPDHLLP